MPKGQEKKPRDWMHLLVYFSEPEVELLEELMEEAHKDHRSFSGFCRMLLYRWMEREKRKVKNKRGQGDLGA